MTNLPKKIEEMTDAERFPVLVKRFEEGLLDGIREIAKEAGGSWTPSAPNLKAAAIPAFDECMTSDFDAAGVEIQHSPRLMINVWNAVLKINESAYRQHLMRLEKAKQLGFELKTEVAAKAGEYV
jgi:hypothetical protein